MARRTREEAEQTRLAIMDTAMAVFARRGFAGTSLEEIAGELGVTRGAIYGHFKCKKDLFESVIGLSRDMIYELADEAVNDTGPPIEALRRFMLGWMRLLAEDTRYRDSFEILLNKTELTDELRTMYRKEKRLTQDVIASLEAVVRRAILWGDVPEGTDPWFAGLLIYCQLMGITQSWLFNPKLFVLCDRAEPFADAIIASLRGGDIDPIPFSRAACGPIPGAVAGDGAKRV